MRSGSHADPGLRASIIIPHLNQVGSLHRCLASIMAQGWPPDRFEVIVVDNGSSVPLDAVQRTWPGVRFLREPQPGPGLARNRGVAESSGDLLLFIDADCRAGIGWIDAAVAALLAEPRRGVVGGDVRIDVVDPNRLTALEAYEAVFAYQQRDYIERQRFSGTGNLAMWREVHDAVGPFVGLAFAEDREWGQRATQAGYTIRYVPGMVIYHPARTTFEQLKAKWRRHIAHDWNAHVEAGRSSLAWYAVALAMIASILVHSLRIVGSPRLSGLIPRLKAIGLLARIRLFRCAEMFRLSRTGDAEGALSWNRRT